MRTGFIFTIILSTLALHRTPVHAQKSAYASQYIASIELLGKNLLSNGGVIASPSQSEPNYYYDWVRDTSLTMKTVIDLAYDQSLAANYRAALAQHITLWIDWELARQVTPKLTGLGEPKFYVNGKADFDPWGRPQNDGPALRAEAAINLAFHYMQEGKFDIITTKLYRAEPGDVASTLIKRDLEYIAKNWSQSSFDLWEEEKGMHYYTLTSQRAALMKGARLATLLKDPGAASYYNTQAAAIANYLASFYDPKQGIIRYALNKVNSLKKSDLDVAVLLATIQTYDGHFYVDVPKVVNTVNKLSAAFQSIYKINQNNVTQTNLGIAMGRYPEDRYNGYETNGQGNPWFLSTLALAEFACQMARIGGLPPTTIQALKNTAVKQFNTVLYHRLATGNLSEQFNRDSGIEQGAHDLTWSYTSYITAYRACYPLLGK